MAKRVSPGVPIARRVIEFGKDDFIEKSFLREIPQTENTLEELAENALVLIDGNDIVQYATEYPIVVYKGDERCIDTQPEPRLNSFVLYIAVSTGLDGRRYSIDSGKMEEELTGYDTIAYFEDPIGIRHQIMQYDICNFLLKKPELVVSEEGVLVFYTEDQILVTTDCNQYAWVHLQDEVGNYLNIEKIAAHKEYCTVNIVKKEAVHDFIDATYKEEWALNFDFTVAGRNMIEPKLTKIG